MRAELFRQSWPAEGVERAALINVHGLGDHSGLYPSIAEYFPPRGVSVHALDLPGHGRSPGRRGHVDSWLDYQEAIDRFVDQVAGDAAKQPFLMGHSLGGLNVLDYALHHPDRIAGVIAAAPALGAVDVPAFLMRLGRVASRLWPTLSLPTGMDIGGLSREPAMVRRAVDDPLFHRKGTARLSTEYTTAVERVQRAAPTLAVPVLLLHGGADRMVLPAGTRAFFHRLSLADRTLIEYPGAYHALFADLDTPLALADVGRWIDRHL